jgi:acetolactate synthase-1/2/3 large subunit
VHSEQADKNAFQELDHLELFRGVAKWVRRVMSVERIDDYVDMAFAAAASGRPGPAVLIAPIDLFSLAARPRNVRGASLGVFPLDRCVADPSAVAAGADLIANARAPIVIAGGGVHGSDGAGALVLLIGNRTNQNGTDSWSLYPPDAKYICIDIDPLEIGRNYEPAVRLVGDARLTLEALNAALRSRDLKVRRQERPAIEARIAAGIKSWKADLSRAVRFDQTPVRPERLMRDLDALLTPETIVVADASYSSIWVANFLTARAAGARFITPRGLAGLGWGLPFALGAKVARPDAPVFCLVGDGGFAHVWSELETARRMRLPVVVTVLNNQILGYQKHAEKVTFGDYSDVCDFESVDHAAIARACGCEGVRVEDPAAFLPALRAAFAAERTTVIDVVTDERAYPPITSFEGAARLQY